MNVRTRVARNELTVRFSVPIRVLRHTPRERGTLLQIAVEPLQVEKSDLGAFVRDESLLPPRDVPDLPLTDVRYRGGEPGGALLELRFERDVRFEVRAGQDFRSVVIEVERRQVDAYAVQIGSPPVESALPTLPDLPALRGRRVYVATIVQGGRSWRRLRLGFFSERSEAEAVAAQLEQAFPGALVVEVTQREIRLSEATSLSQPRAEPPRATPAPDLFTRLIDEAALAMTGGEYPKAILIYTKLLSLPENERSPEAQELLGLARERSGQLAHAKAEYEEYLRRYPEGEAAERVRQRLSTLITAGAPEREPLEQPEPEPERAAWPRFDNTASLFASYRHETLLIEEDDNQLDDTLADSSLYTDVYLDSRFSGERYTARAQASGGYYHDFLGSGASGMHLSSAFLEGSATRAGLTGSLGRRSLSTSGVLGRYDGGRVAKRVGERWETALVSGLPVNSPSQDSIDTDRYFVGGSVAGDQFFDLFDAEVFAIHQMVGQGIDRSAVGGELRYFQDGRSLFAYVDYDVYFQSLNIAQLSGNAQLSQRAFVHLLADYRNAPILTTSNALQGQLVSSLGDLEELLSKSEIEALAEDRTSQALFLNLGGSYNLRDDLQLAADASATQLTGTGDSGDCSDPASTSCVPGFDGTGFEFLYSTQLIANGLLRAGDVGIVGLRYLDGSAFDAVTLTLSSRQPFTEFLRLEPRMLTEYRLRKRGFGDELLLRPGLGLEFRRWKLDFDVEGGAEWLRREGNGDELGWYGLVGVRFDY